jgi:hypothetical protein
LIEEEAEEEFDSLTSEIELDTPIQFVDDYDFCTTNTIIYYKCKRIK